VTRQLRRQPALAPGAAGPVARAVPGGRSQSRRARNSTWWAYSLRAGFRTIAASGAVNCRPALRWHTRKYNGGAYPETRPARPDGGPQWRTRTQSGITPNTRPERKEVRPFANVSPRACLFDLPIRSPNGKTGASRPGGVVLLTRRRETPWADNLSGTSSKVTRLTLRLEQQPNGTLHVAPPCWTDATYGRRHPTPAS